MKTSRKEIQQQLDSNQCYTYRVHSAVQVLGTYCVGKCFFCVCGDNGLTLSLIHMQTSNVSHSQTIRVSIKWNTSKYSPQTDNNDNNEDDDKSYQNPQDIIEVIAENG